ncbi:MAG: hypothetical protein OHK0029_28940 [Armatimonadaceae bacterium]
MSFVLPVRVLDPRYYRVDDILRRPYTATTPLGSSGAYLRVGAPQGWGIPGEVYWNSPGAEAMGPIRLNLMVDGISVEPGDTIYRPSHVTLHGRHEETGLQITEDKFVTRDDVLVSVLKLRNPGEIHVHLKLDLGWGIPAGEVTLPDGRSVYVFRQGPPLDDLWQTIPEQGVRTLVMAVAVGSHRDEARIRAHRWTDDPNPTVTQATEYQKWFDEEVPLFECSDPWITKAWYQQWVIARQSLSTPELKRLKSVLLTTEEPPMEIPSEPSPSAAETREGIEATDVREQFEWGSYDLPRMQGTARAAFEWIRQIQCRWIGLRVSPNARLELKPNRAGMPEERWQHFCLQGVSYEDHHLTILWDNPANEQDHVGMGIKGLAVFVNSRMAHFQTDLSLVVLPLDANS